MVLQQQEKLVALEVEFEVEELALVEQQEQVESTMNSVVVEVVVGFGAAEVAIELGRMVEQVELEEIDAESTEVEKPLVVVQLVALEA